VRNATERRRVGGIAAALSVALLLAAFAAAVATAGPGAAGSTKDATRATARFHDLTVAKRAGYGLLEDRDGVACIAMDEMPGMGAMGVHYVKSSLVASPTLDVRTPEALVYAPAGGRLRLAAVEYVVLKSAWGARHASPPSLFGHAFNLTPAGNRFGLPAFYSLHAWIWKHNPAGTYAMWNPDVRCR
jgi:hypothetical protein